MKHARVYGTLTCLALWAAHAPGWAVYADGKGRDWRQVLDTRGLDWADLAGACPMEASAPCDGVVRGVDLGGWTWANRAQVKDLFNALLAAQPDGPPQRGLSDAVGSVAGPGYYWLAASLLHAAFEPTFLWPTNYSTSVGVAGMTSTLVAGGGVVVGSFGYGHAMVSLEGHFAVEATLAAPPPTGAWLWRPSAAQRDAPVRAIPEAGTALMWATGFVGMWVTVRRRVQPCSRANNASHNGAVTTKPSVENTIAAVASDCIVL